MTDSIATAQKLLEARAVTLNPASPFTWASGWKSPIYCDNRKLLSLPFVRDYVKSELANAVFERFPDADLIAGVATAGIAWGAMVADQLKLPFVYVRPKPKEHGLGNQIEGAYSAGQRAAVVEDLVSTGRSSLQAAEALRGAGVAVVGMVSIFNYGFEAAQAAFSQADIALHSLTSYPTLLKLALRNGTLTEAEERVLLKWQHDPAGWTGMD